MRAWEPHIGMGMNGDEEDLGLQKSLSDASFAVNSWFKDVSEPTLLLFQHFLNAFDFQWKERR